MKETKDVIVKERRDKWPPVNARYTTVLYIHAQYNNYPAIRMYHEYKHFARANEEQESDNTL